MTKGTAKTKAAAGKEASALDFESAMASLEALVEKLESGELALADSLEQFERGVALSRQCQALLEQAQLKVTQLTQADDPNTERVFDPDT
ncbi:MAG: exodeoxyribonuclease VII small subunit [Wenzhouxiangella sp.]